MAANDLDVIFTNKADTVFVMADGQLLWRVIENLLVNVSKYAPAWQQSLHGHHGKSGHDRPGSEKYVQRAAEYQRRELMERF